MAETTQRTIVDGVDYVSMFRWPRIFRAITASLQPPRIVLCLFLIALLLGVGQLWDGMTAASVRPEGITAGRWTDLDTTQSQPVLTNALRRYAIDMNDVSVTTPDPIEPGVTRTRVDPALVIVAIDEAYAARVAEAGPTEREVERRAYELAMREIEAVRPQGVFEATSRHVTGNFVAMVREVLRLDLLTAAAFAGNIFVDLPIVLARDHLAFLIIYGLFAVIVFALGGVAICRMAACQYAGDVRLPLRSAIDFSLGHWVSAVLTPLLPLLLVAGLGVVILLLGLLMLIPAINVVGALLYGLALVLGVIVALMLIAYAAGFPMLLPALACENCGAGDSMQRSFAYVLQRPMHLVAYLLIAIVALVIGYLLVATVAAVVLNVAASLYSAFTETSALAGAGAAGVFDLAPARAMAPVPHDSWHAATAASIIAFWEAIVVMSVAAYVLAFIYDASTVIYLLMRRAADGQDIEEVWQPGLVPGTMAPVGTSQQ